MRSVFNKLDSRTPLQKVMLCSGDQDSSGAEFTQSSVGDVVNTLINAGSNAYSSYLSQQQQQANAQRQNTMWTVILIAVGGLVAISLLK